MTFTKTRPEWAADICAIHQRTVESIFEMGHMLIAAKKELPHGEFTAMVAADLPFGKRTAQMLMAIAADTRLSKANQGSLLPAAWRVLYELHRLPDAELEQAMTSGAINQQTTREDVRIMRADEGAINALMKRAEVRTMRINLLPPEVITRPPFKIVVHTEDAAPMRHTIEHLPRASLHQIERLVRELQAEIERGEVVVDAAFSSLARSVAAQLLAMA